ncbi:hypothetical protein NE237_011139 [Protea cynaroides]|uniref:UPF0261 domain-containing protein n=1 Tax=Protea cynaroides TaxID=273540 RepID=A0A9Q0GWH0_9MAGN|nr:hypothetical protein NE237_011139 [Protea cynaroides]
MASLQSQVKDRDETMARLQSQVEKLTQFVILNQSLENSVNLVMEHCEVYFRFCYELDQTSKLIQFQFHQGQFFYDPKTTRALLVELERLVEINADRQVKRYPYHINDPEFATALVDLCLDISVDNSKDASLQQGKLHMFLPTSEAGRRPFLLVQGLASTVILYLL